MPPSRRQLPHLIAALPLALALLPASAGAAGLSVGGNGEPNARFAPGEAIVRFEPGTSPRERLEARRAADVELDHVLDIAQAQVVEVDGSVAATVDRLERLDDVAFAQPNYRYQAHAVAPPNDTFFGDLWGLGATPGVNALSGWESSRGAGQVIAVIDTGVDLTHPDLRANLWTNPAEPVNGIDDDGDSFIDDVHGADLVDSDGDPDDFHFHGTHVAGIAAAASNNGTGVAGVAPQARIMAVRVLDGDGSGYSSDIATGIVYASRKGADVINLSLGGSPGIGDLLTSSAVAEADTRDVVVVASAGNSASDNDAKATSPCTLPQPNLICVAAVDRQGGLSGFSNYGAKTVDVGAPGGGPPTASGPGQNILSANASYGAPLLTDLFDIAGLPGWSTPAGSAPWGESQAALPEESPTSVSGQSATDSPAGDYAAEANIQMNRSLPIDLTGQRGCRMNFSLRYDIQPTVNGEYTDVLLAGAYGYEGPSDYYSSEDTLKFAGSSDELFVRTEVSISDLDGLAEAYPAFALFSDAADQRDGAYVDNLRLICRSQTYTDTKASAPTYDPSASGSYVELRGTSMAAPHVAGVAALVAAADPGVPDTQVVQALKEGSVPLAALSGKTVSGGTVDARRAIDRALALPNSPPVSVPPLVRPDLGKSRKRIRVTRTRRFAYAFRATPGLSGQALFRTLGKLRRSPGKRPRRARLTLADPSFEVPASGQVRLRVRLSRREQRILRLNRKLVVRVEVTVRDDSGRAAMSRKRLTLLAPRS